jgi:hypothetical protein
MRIPIMAMGLLLFARVAQAGWTPGQRLTWTAGTSEEYDLTIDHSDNLHLVWEDYAPGNAEIFYRKGK